MNAEEAREDRKSRGIKTLSERIQEDFIRAAQIKNLLEQLERENLFSEEDD